MLTVETVLPLGPGSLALEPGDILLRWKKKKRKERKKGRRRKRRRRGEVMSMLSMTNKKWRQGEESVQITFANRNTRKIQW